MTSLKTVAGRIQYLKERNDKLKELRESAKNLDTARVKECTESVIEGYQKATNTEHMSIVNKESSIEGYRFNSIGLHVAIDKNKFQAPDYYWVRYFTDVGRAIASGEQKYIQRRISSISTDFGKLMSYDNPDFSMIAEGIRSLLSKNIRPDILLMPIDLHTKFIQYSPTKLDWNMNGPPQLSEEGCKLKVFWSNKFAPLQSIMIFNSRAGIWHVLENENGEARISFALGESEQRGDQVAYFVETLAYFFVADKEAFVKIKLSHEGNHDVESIKR